ncbi:EAL domain-containing protein [Virgibacillus indicus]|nr:EAL domain-containing protein [Virgibacillus indicus]
MSNEKIDLPFLQKILSNLKEAILFVRADGEILDGNQSAFSLLNKNGPSQESIYDYFNFELLMESDESHLLLELKDRNDYLIEVKCISATEDVYCLIMNKLSLDDKTSEIKNYVNHLIDSSVDGIVIYNEKGIIDCDPSFASLFGYTHTEMKQQTFSNLIDSKSNELLIEEVHTNPEKFYELNGLQKDGHSINFEIMQHPYNNQGTIVRMAVINDITERITNEKKIEYMAYYDELTDLPNRNFFLKVLKNAINKASDNNESLAVYFMDIDYFREINDTLGYDFGDNLLRACGRRLKTFLETDTFIARLDGDEFLILQRNVPDNEAAASLAESLIAEFEKPIDIDGYEIFVSVSIGISVFPENGTTPQDLLKHADSAMYLIKEKNHNNYKVFESSISEKLKTMFSMDAELRQALSRNQFELHYQPQKDLRTGKVAGMEALLRWNHPERGYIPPLDFISLAEKNGFILEIGDWVMREACKQNKAWQEQGYKPIIVSVNLSAKQFHQEGLVEKIETILTETGLASKYLELEITESISMTNEKYITSTMQQLRKLGVLVSIDDFGTGYSSLKYLSLFPITKLKIDKTFMDGTQRHNQAIVKSIIQMSHSLNMKVIAEGVETNEQLTFLENEKCDEMQGFYFSKPLPPEQLSSLLETV